MLISVIIPTYNPNLKRLEQTLEGLRHQTLSFNNWELIIINNNSTEDFSSKIDLSWHLNCKVVEEQKQGLTFARIKGFETARSPLIIMVDDDNILYPNYLEEVLKIFKNDPDLGAIGGRSLPKFEDHPPVWLKEFYGSLALKDMGDHIITNKWDHTYPSEAPIGAGMAIRKVALQTYIKKIYAANSILPDRQGTSLSSGGDNDIILEILKSGWKIGYFPSIILEHIISLDRMKVEYLSRLVNNTSKSWIQLLQHHKINPWKLVPSWTIPLRKLKAYFSYRAWSGESQYIKWQGACGMLDGLNKSLYN